MSGIYIETDENMELNDRQLKLTKHRVETLNSLGIFSLESLLTYYPVRYDILNTVPYDEWLINDRVSFQAEVVSRVVSWRYGGRKTVSKFDVLAFGTYLHITIYNRPWSRNLSMNEIITVTGIYKGKGNVTAVSYTEKPITDIPRITPVYASKAGVQQKTIRDSIRKVLSSGVEIRDIVPQKYIAEYRLLSRPAAMEKIHFPQTEEDIAAALRTLKYEEFLKYFTAVRLSRDSLILPDGKKPKAIDRKKIGELISSVPFEPTADQIRTIEDILRDMSSDKPMYRLVQGDVGCGKTFVAEAAVYASYLSGMQSTLLAPTEILADQHFLSFSSLLSPYGLRIELLHSGMKSAQRRKILEDLESGAIDVLIGTHSILQEDVVFRELGLVIADEQQRFGVEQRRTLRDKGTQVDFLLMSATPIPRTLAGTIYGDMEVSTIETMPPGRKPVITELIRENSFRTVLPDVNALLEEGRQLYVICAALEDNPDYDARNVIDVGRALEKLFMGKASVGILHGQMNSALKQSVMNDFEDNRIQVLVSTTVVEVGVNVINATGMIIYDADRFGMSQIHQLRGRVQRGSSQGICWLLTDSEDEKSLERLRILAETTDGFRIAYEDLRLRGPGDILGTRQSGLPGITLGNLVEDTNILNTARKDAADILEDRDNPEYSILLNSVIEENRRNSVYID